MPKLIDEGKKRAEVLELRARGASYRDIAAQLRISQGFIARVCREARDGTPPPSPATAPPAAKGEDFDLDEEEPPPPKPPRTAPRPADPSPPPPARHREVLFDI